MSGTRKVKVTVSRTIQLNQFEPLTVSLEEEVHDVPKEKAEKVRDRLYADLLESVDKKIKIAIKEYRIRK